MEMYLILSLLSGLVTSIVIHAWLFPKFLADSFPSASSPARHRSEEQSMSTQPTGHAVAPTEKGIAGNPLNDSLAASYISPSSVPPVASVLRGGKCVKNRLYRRIHQRQNLEGEWEAYEVLTLRDVDKTLAFLVYVRYKGRIEYPPEDVVVEIQSEHLKMALKECLQYEDSIFDAIPLVSV